jgi:orotidine-5'-phosphate decarboxylase
MPNDQNQTTNSKCGLIVALDTDDFLRASLLAKATAPYAGMFKVGLELWLTHGRPGWDMLKMCNRPLMLDLKFNDIPNTMERAVRAVMPLKPTFITVHASAGRDALKAACDAVDGEATVLAITVLTSLTNAGLRSIGVEDGASVQARRLAELAFEAGVRGMVCGPHEVADLRSHFGPNVKLVVPGIRSADVAANDQARPSTPRNAAMAGADWIVVGRPISESDDPAGVAASIAAECQERQS